MSFETEKVFTKNWSKPKSWSIDTFKSTGGYDAYKKAIGMTSEEIIQEAMDSNLRGRGGAGFPAGRKWSFVPKDSEKPRYLAINADESEPGTFKDRYIMEKDPHMVIEGGAILCRAIKSHQIYLYIRGEFGLAYHRMVQAVNEAYEAGVLGESSMGSGYRLDMAVHRGAGAYICGEETAMLESIEGKKGQPRLKPPFPAIEGLFHCPTIVNNVETVSAVGPIIDKGAGWWKGLSRTEAEGGNKLVGLSGHVAKPGVYELPNGLTLKEVIYDVGGGMRHKDRPLKAVIPGGSSCPILKADEIDVGFDFDAMMKSGSVMGTGCPTVIEEGTCMVRLLQRIERFYAHESCGQCTPCREGGDWLFKILTRIEEGRGTEEDVDLIDTLPTKIEGHTICPFGEALSWPARSYVKKFRDEFMQHVHERKCPFGPISVAPLALRGALS